MKFWPLILFLLLITVSCTNTARKEYLATNSNILYNGRIQKNADSSVALIGAASYAQMTLVGDSCIIHLSNGDRRHGYVSIEINDYYRGRYQVTNKPIKLSLGSAEASEVRIMKDTEASTGDVIFNKVLAENVVKTEAKNAPLIEFIGNSITCGMGVQTEEVPCGSGEWYDQHNAYLAYGPRTARMLNLNFRLSCVSGMGMYRNWNDEGLPVMPDVYENLRLNDDSTNVANFERKPDLVSIALGTNDLSLGDGEKERSEFNQVEFITNYIQFVEMIFDHFPETKVSLLTSPMIGEREQKILLESLQRVKDHFSEKPVYIFEFEKMKPQGCGGHPDIEDHKKMADQLAPFIKDILKK